MSKIQLKTSSILNVPLHKYEEFTFIVNKKEYKTSCLIAELLSPRICKIHSFDPTIDSITINTQSTGDFSHILDLINFNQHDLLANEIPFIIEIIENLENESIELTEIDNQVDITNDNVLSLIKEHEKHFNFFHYKYLSKEIDFASSNLFELLSSKEEEIMKFQKRTIELILSNPNIQIETEDQLISFINKLYESDQSYSNLYQFVIFTNVSQEKMKEFIQIFNYNDLTTETWNSISSRLEEKINIEQNNVKDSRYKKKQKGIQLPYVKNHEFEGIINYFKTKKEGELNNYIKITSTKLESDSHSTIHVVNYQEKRDYFSSGPFENPWICFDFKDKKIILSNYTIRGYHSSNQPRSWVIEGTNFDDNDSNDKWETIDEHKDCDDLKGGNKTHTFSIKNSNNKSYRYIRMRSTGIDWCNGRYLCINAIEFYGSLI